MQESTKLEWFYLESIEADGTHHYIVEDDPIDGDRVGEYTSAGVAQRQVNFHNQNLTQVGIEEYAYELGLITAFAIHYDPSELSDTAVEFPAPWTVEIDEDTCYSGDTAIEALKFALASVKILQQADDAVMGD